MKLTDNVKRGLKAIILTIFIIYIFCLCLTWLMAIGYDKAPDEEMKFDVCQYIFKNGKLPHGGDASIRNSQWGISYAFTPILSYIISAIFMKITSFFTLDFQYIIWSARLVSVLCITLYGVMCYKIGNKLFEGIYKWLFTVFVTLLPQIVFLGSYINNDSLALLSTSIIVYSWIIGLEKNWNWKSCIVMGLGIGICSLSYYNSYGYILCSIIIYFVSCYIKKINIKEFFKKGIVIALIAFAIGGWWFVRNFIIYDGDFLGINISREYGEKYAKNQYKPSNRNTPANKNYSLKYMLFDMRWLELTSKSFIGLFGYMNVPMNPVIYERYYSVFAFGILGIFISIIINFFKAFKKDKSISKKDKAKGYEKVLFNMMMIFCIIIAIGLSIYYSYFMDFQPQGRYIMPIIIPFMYFIVLGIKNILDVIIKNKSMKIVIIFFVIIVWSIMPIFICCDLLL